MAAGRSDVEAMAEMARQLWEKYFKPRVISELLGHSLDGYRAVVATNNDDGTLTVKRPFDSAEITLKCPPSLSVSAQTGDQVLVVTLGDMSNAFVLCKTDLTGLGGGDGVRPTEYDFDHLDSDGYFFETVEGDVTTRYNVTRDAQGRIDSITDVTDGFETVIDWGNTSWKDEAADVEYDNTGSGLTATDVQSAIDEIAQGGGTAPAASAVSYDNTDSGLAATNVQDAIDEVAADIPSVPSPSDATPQALGTAAPGSSADYSRADHVHQKPSYSASDVGLGNVANVLQYSAQNPPPADASKQDKITASGILKGDGNGGVSAAVAGTDYQTPLVFDNYPAIGSNNPVTSDGIALGLSDLRTDMMEVFEIASFSSLPKTVQFVEMTDQHRVLRMTLSNPLAQVGDWTITTANGSFTISGSISGSTAMTLVLGHPVASN